MYYSNKAASVRTYVFSNQPVTGPYLCIYLFNIMFKFKLLFVLLYLQLCIIARPRREAKISLIIALNVKVRNGEKSKRFRVCKNDASYVEGQLFPSLSVVSKARFFTNSFFYIIPQLLVLTAVTETKIKLDSKKEK